MSGDNRDVVVTTVLALLFAVSVAGLVNALILEAERNSKPQPYVITIEYVPEAKESKQ